MKVVLSIICVFLITLLVSDVMATFDEEMQERRYMSNLASRIRFPPGLNIRFANVPARQRRANNLSNMMRLGKRAILSTYEESQPLLEAFTDPHLSTF